MESKEDPSGRKTITKVNVLSGKSASSSVKSEQKEYTMILSYAKDLVVAGKSETLDQAVDALMIAGEKIKNWKPTTDDELPDY